MPEVGTAWVSIVPSFRGGASALTRQLSRETTRASARAGQESGRGWGRAFSTQAMVGVNTFTSGTTSAFASVSARLRGLTGLAAAAGLALGAAGIAGGVMGLKTAASLQQAQIAFETLLGSGQKAAAFLTDLKSFAARTPFQLPGLIDASRQLIGVGQSAKSVIPTLTAWGDTAGALGLSQEQFSRAMLAVTQSMSKGKVQAEELMQITEAGIPIWPLLSRAMGKTVPQLQELSSKGQLLAKDVFPALEKQMGREYGGAMAKQSKTLAGLWSTLMDTLEMGLADAIGPLIPALQDAMPKAINALSAGLKVAGRVIGRIFTTLEPLADRLGPLAGKAFAALGRMFAAAAKGARVFFTAISGGKTSNLGALTGPLRLLADIGTALHDAFTAAAPVVAKFGQALSTGLGDIGTRLAPALRALVAAVRGLVASVWPQIRAFATQLASVLGPALRQIVGILATQVIPAFTSFVTAIRPVANLLIGILGPAVIGVFQGGLDIIKGGLRILAGLFSTVAALLKGDWRAAWNGIKQIAAGAWKALTGAFTVFVNGSLLKVFRLGLGALGRLASSAWNGLKALFTKGNAAMRTATSAGVSAVVGFFASLPGRVLTPLGTLITSLAGFFTRTMTAAAKAVADGGASLLKWFTDLPGNLIRGTADFGGALIGAGEKLIKGLWDGIKRMAGKMIDWFKRNVVDRLRGLMPFSPAKWGPLRAHPMDQAGANLVRMLTDGIKAQTPRLLRQVEQLAAATAGIMNEVGSFTLEPGINADAKDWRRTTRRLAPTPLVRSASPQASSVGGGDTIIVNAHAVDLDEGRLARVLYAARLRQRVSRPR